MDTIATLQNLVDALHPLLQFLAVFVIGLVPFLEGDAGAVIGVLAGIAWPLTVLAGAAGTLLASVAVVKLGGRIADPQDRGQRDRRVLGRVERWGIPVAMVVSGFLVSVIIAALIMAGARLHRPTILVSAAVAALINAVFGALVAAGVIQVAGVL